MALTSNQITIRVNQSPVPAWYSQLNHKQWASPVSNWLGATGVKDPLETTNTINVGQSAIIPDWNGMGADQDDKIIWMAGNGGHNGYGGNEVYVCDLRVESPQWVRDRNADVRDATRGEDTAVWANGQPASDHTGNIQIAAERRWFKLGMNSVNFLGGSKGGWWWEYNRTTKQYTLLFNNKQSLRGIHGLTAWDPQDRQLIVVRPDNTASPTRGLEFVNISDFSTAVSNTNWIDVANTPMGGVDTTNRVLMLYWPNRTTNNLFCVSLANNTTKAAGYTRITTTGNSSRNNQLHWHAPSNAWITWDDAQGIRKLTPTVSGGLYTGATWSTVTTGFSGVSVPADTTNNKMYNKIQLIQDMGDGTSALVVVPRYANPDVYVCRLTGAV